MASLKLAVASASEAFRMLVQFEIVPKTVLFEQG